MSDKLKILQDVAGKPWLLFTLAIVGIVYGWIEHVQPAREAVNSEFQEKYLTSQVENVRLQAELDQINAQQISDITDELQQFVEAQNPNESWFKVRNYTEGEWELVAINEAYEKDFCIYSRDSKGKTVFEAYGEQRSQVKEAQKTLLKQYQLNDDKASRLRRGCLQFTEWVIPCDGKPEKRVYKKCPMTSGKLFLMYGERVPQ